MTSAIAHVAPRSIVVDYDLAHPPETVWRLLTDSGLLASWLMANDFKPVVGHRFTFRAQPTPGWDGVVHCEVLVVDRPTRLSYTWRGGSEDLARYGAGLDTVVTWTLQATPTGGTLLRLDHSGFTAKNDFAFETMGKGWREGVAQRLGKVLATLD
jgi:uncharacterized protein YndB with AHSA1/START domain